MSDLRSESNSWKIKTKALDSIEQIIEPKQNFNTLMNHIQAFINFLSNVTRDTNNNVVSQSLNLINKVLKRDSSVVTKITIDDMIPMLIQKLGDANTSVRLAAFQIFETLNAHLHPKSYMSMIIPYLTMSSLNFKEEIIQCLNMVVVEDKIKKIPANDLKKTKAILAKVAQIEKRQRTKTALTNMVKLIEDIQE